VAIRRQTPQSRNASTWRAGFSSVWRTEADAGVALCFGRMQLTQCNHGLAIALLVEGDGGPELARI
jgi:hypothetical protein